MVPHPQEIFFPKRFFHSLLASLRLSSQRELLRPHIPAAAVTQDVVYDHNNPDLVYFPRTFRARVLLGGGAGGTQKTSIVSETMCINAYFEYLKKNRSQSPHYRFFSRDHLAFFTWFNTCCTPALLLQDNLFSQTKYIELTLNFCCTPTIFMLLNFFIIRVLTDYVSTAPAVRVAK